MALTKFYKSMHSTFTYNIPLLYNSAAQGVHTIVFFGVKNSTVSIKQSLQMIQLGLQS